MSNENNAQTVSIAMGATNQAFFQGISDAGDLERSLDGNTRSGHITPEDWAFAVGRAVALRFGEDSFSDEAAAYVSGLMNRAPNMYRVETHTRGDFTFEDFGHQVKVHVHVDPDDEDVAPVVSIQTQYHEQPKVQVNGERARFVS
jgi:hypothetical protein